jgi:hypothetical protein
VVAQTFTAVIEAAPRGGSLIPIPAHVLAGLDGGSRFRVTGTLDGVPFESSTMPMGQGRVCLGVHKATRESAGVAIGDEVEVRLERDNRPREVAVPDDLAAALAGDAEAEAAFEGLAFTHRREYVEWITSAKRDETRARRINETLVRVRS